LCVAAQPALVISPSDEDRCRGLLVRHRIADRGTPVRPSAPRLSLLLRTRGPTLGEINEAFRACPVHPGTAGRPWRGATLPRLRPELDSDPLPEWMDQIRLT